MQDTSYFTEQMQTTFAEAAGAYRREYSRLNPYCRQLLQTYEEQRESLYAALPDFRALFLELDDLYVELRNYQDNLLYAQGFNDGLWLLFQMQPRL